MANEITKTGVCDSCGNDTAVTAVPHHQANNPKLWWYCNICKFAHDKEKKVQALLRVIAATDPAAADNGEVVARAHEQVAAELLAQQASEAKLAPNEELVDAVTPEEEVAAKSTTIADAPKEATTK